MIDRSVGFCVFGDLVIAYRFGYVFAILSCFGCFVLVCVIGFYRCWLNFFSTCCGQVLWFGFGCGLTVYGLRLGVGLRLRFGVCGTSCLSVLFGFDFVFDCVWLILLVIVNSVG